MLLRCPRIAGAEAREHPRAGAERTARWGVRRTRAARPAGRRRAGSGVGERACRRAASAPGRARAAAPARSAALVDLADAAASAARARARRRRAAARRRRPAAARGAARRRRRPSSRSTALQASSSSSGPSAVSTRSARVEEVRLVEHLALRRGLVDRRRREHRDAVRAQRRARGAQVGEPVALVGAQAEVPDDGGHQSASRQTSTATSSTGSGIGGSGLAALTRTDSTP